MSSNGYRCISLLERFQHISSFSTCGDFDFAPVLTDLQNMQELTQLSILVSCFSSSYSEWLHMLHGRIIRLLPFCAALQGLSSSPNTVSGPAKISQTDARLTQTSTEVRHEWRVSHALESALRLARIHDIPKLAEIRILRVQHLNFKIANLYKAFSKRWSGLCKCLDRWVFVCVAMAVCAQPIRGSARVPT